MAAPNTSATGGPLLPTSPPAPPLEGEDLLGLIGDWIAPLVGMDRNLVRPAWQPEPSNIPTAGTAWIAYRITERPADTFPYLSHDGNDAGGLGSDTLQRNEELRMLCSVYDLGSTGLADSIAAQLRDAMAVPQNLEPLLASDILLGSVGALVAVPAILSTRWLYRVDLPVLLRRQINRKYAVENILSADGTVHTDVGLSFPIAVNPPT